jgi:hypothetical protein
MPLIGVYKPNEGKNPKNNPKGNQATHLQGWTTRPINNLIKIITNENLKDN